MPSPGIFWLSNHSPKYYAGQLMTVLFLFLDGVGLGADDPSINPLALASLPTLTSLLGGHKMVSGGLYVDSNNTRLRPLDACLGVDGLPQSATGQAVLLTGVNVPQSLGYHYGPKPDRPTAEFLSDGGIFGEVSRRGKKAALLNAYPPGYFEGIESGYRLLSSIPLAVTNAGLRLHTLDDLLANRAISADFTGHAWSERMDYPQVPTSSPSDAGRFLGQLARQYDFSFFEYWLSDYAGHRQDMQAAIQLLTQLDAVLAGLLSEWSQDDLLLITSDHGNLEDLSTRRHTSNPVPLLLHGSEASIRCFDGVQRLDQVAPAILRSLDQKTGRSTE